MNHVSGFGLQGAADEGLAAALAQLVEHGAACAGPRHGADAIQGTAWFQPREPDVITLGHGYVRTQAACVSSHDTPAATMLGASRSSEYRAAILRAARSGSNTE
ncbi:hypothetical protein [Nonomuraea jabiensis]|uniref:hypothetical protein n=1 Tax=Nonomuraea jabiensis TaxID=882448 RepID=UPI0036A156F1